VSRVRLLATIAAWLAAGALAGSPASAADPAPPASLALADSAWAKGDPAAAKRLYASVLAAEPDRSRAVFRLASLSDDPGEALRLYRRYVTLEPGDAWGHMALGDAWSRRGETAAAIAEYDVAARLAPDDRDVAVGRARVADRAGQREAAAATRERWLAAHPGDRPVWEDLGRTWLEAGRPRRAIAAYRHGLADELGATAARRLRLAEALAGPAFEPRSRVSRDADGDRTVVGGFVADVAVADGARLGLDVSRARVEDATAAARVDDVRARLELRPRAAWRIEAGAGLARLDLGAGGSATRAVGDVRARRRAGAGSPALDLRAERAPLAATPGLVADRAMRDEGRLHLEWPVSRLRLRGDLRGARIASAGTINWRREAGAGLGIAVSPAVTPWVQVRVSGFRDPTDAGYFAPRRCEAATLGASVELGEGSPWTLSLDAGAGAQRFAARGPLQPWALALASDDYASCSLGAGRELRIGVELENSPGLASTAATGERWSYGALSLALRWALR